ncbi:MAG: Holliday junction resolvase RuvX [Rickettsiales bacterium]|jgi:putative Holliday junction resolvase|nr:Holliday junction resolvase RuvX [Rickettsiales bacterium]
MHHFLTAGNQVAVFDDLEKFEMSLSQGRRLLGLDVGLKRIGLALSDRGWNVATPKSVLRRKTMEKDAETITSLALENDVCAIVCGIPLAEDGGETRTSLFIRNFAVYLDGHIHIPILLTDERLTSFMAEEFLIADMGGSHRDTKKIVDKVAASYILQSVLDRLGEYRQICSHQSIGGENI